MKKVEKVIYKCLSCEKKFERNYNGWKPSTICVKCGKTAWYIDLLPEQSSVSVRKFKDVTALVIDKKTGEPLWLDGKGHKLKYDSSDVRYDLVHDPHGWKSTGKKVREYDKYGRKYSVGR